MPANANLVLHAGAQEVTYADIAAVTCPEPTDTWHPVPHTTVLDCVRNRLAELHFDIKVERYGLMKDGMRCFGTIDLQHTIMEGVGLAIGWRNALDKSMSAGICVGERVFVCDNLAFNAEIVSLRRHTKHIMRDLPHKVGAALAKLPLYAEAVSKRIGQMQHVMIESEEQVSHVVRLAAQQDVLPWSQMGKVVAAWEQPAHDVFAVRNAWSLYNAFTEVCKDRFSKNAVEAANETLRLNALFDSVFGFALVVPQAEEVEAN